LAGLVAWFFLLERLWFYTHEGRQYLRELKTQVAQDSSAGSSLAEVQAKWDFPLRRHLNTIGVLAAMAPLMGLLGTVSGMVQTFSNITRFGFGNPVLMADGISEALLTTQAGLVVAFPIVIFHNFLMSRLRKIESIAHQISFNIGRLN
jgi:biopolymer transport protein ExbB